MACSTCGRTTSSLERKDLSTALIAFWTCNAVCLSLSSHVACSEPPVIELSTSHLEVLAGASIPPVQVYVSGEHSGMVVDPPFPPGVFLQIRPGYMRPSNQSYMIVGIFDEALSQSYRVCLKVQSDPVCAILEVRVKQANERSFIRMEITDTIDNSIEYSYQVYSDEEMLLDRSDLLLQHHTLLVVPSPSGHYSVRICRNRQCLFLFRVSRRASFRQEAIQLQIVLNFWNTAFSAMFVGRSVTDLYPCRNYYFTTIPIVTSSDPWLAYRSAFSMPFNWRDSSFDDSSWKEMSTSFPVSTGESIYLRRHILVGSPIHAHSQVHRLMEYSVLLLSILVREGVSLYVNNVEVMRYHLDFRLQENNDMGSSFYGERSATASFSFPRYVSATISHQFLHAGDNIIAAEIHQFANARSNVFFALSASLLASSEYYYASPFPTVTASSDVLLSFRLHARWRMRTSSSAASGCRTPSGRGGAATGSSTSTAATTTST